MKKTTHNASRRNFIKKTSVLAGFSVLPSYLVFGKDSEGNTAPSDRVNLACVGLGGRARVVIPRTLGRHCKAVALCDVDHSSAARATDILNRKDCKDAKKFFDFRKMLEKMDKDIDALTVVTPDHTHFPIAMLAMSMGKHVYVEKPLTHTFQESELLMKAEKKFKVATQMGNQGHSSLASLQFKTWVEKGIIKDIKKIDAWKSGGLWFMSKNQRINKWPTETRKCPIDWDLWCGPSKLRPYTRKCHPFNWRGFYDYGGGMLGDWGPHILDLPHHYLKLGLPTEIECIEMGDHNKIIYPLVTRLKYRFPERGEGMPACDVFWSDGDDSVIPKLDQEKYGPVKLVGKGKLLYGKDMAFLGGSHSETTRVIPQSKQAELGQKLKVKGRTPNHFQSFVKACMGQGKTWSPFSISGELSQVLMLGCITQYLNTSLKFDREKKQFIGNDEANTLLAPPPRKGWEQFYKMV